MVLTESADDNVFNASVEIPGYFTASGGIFEMNFTVFNISTKLRSSKEVIADHRYSDFERLWGSLGEYGGLLPKLPPKFVACGPHTDNSFLRNRMKELQDCLRAIVQHQELCARSDVKSFFLPDSAKQPVLQNCFLRWMQRNQWHPARETDLLEDSTPEKKKGKHLMEGVDMDSWQVVQQALMKQLDEFEIEPANLKTRLVDQLLRQNSEEDLKRLLFNSSQLKHSLEALGVAVRWRSPSNEFERETEKRDYKIVRLPMPIDTALKAMEKHHQSAMERALSDLRQEHELALSTALQAQQQHQVVEKVGTRRPSGSSDNGAAIQGPYITPHNRDSDVNSGAINGTHTGNPLHHSAWGEQDGSQMDKDSLLADMSCSSKYPETPGSVKKGKGFSLLDSDDEAGDDMAGKHQGNHDSEDARLGGAADGDEVDSASASDARWFVSLLETGVVVSKFGRRGKPHRRVVFTVDGGASISWQKPRRGRLTAQTRRSLRMRDVVKVEYGQKTPVFKRKPSKSPYCMSLITAKRTLDIQMDTPEQYQAMAKGLNNLLCQLGRRNAGPTNDTFVPARRAQMVKGTKVQAMRVISGGDKYESATILGPSKKKAEHWAVRFASDAKIVAKPLHQIKIQSS
jgi:hypothetical protein